MTEPTKSPLFNFGLDDWFAERAQEFCDQTGKLARVIIVDRDRYTVHDDQGEQVAQITGHLRHQLLEHSEYPCVGDWVCLTPDQDETNRRIEKVLPRKTFLRRKSAGKHIDYQMIASNIDVALIIQSCHFDFNLRRLERYLVMVNEGGIQPLILLTKTDLLSPSEVEEKIDHIRQAGIEVPIVPVSNVTESGLDEIKKQLQPRRTYCLIGSSGVGKTSLINNLQDKAILGTQTVSETGEGRHTTVRRQLIVLDNGAMLVDTPGMRELGLLTNEENIGSSFEKIENIAENCKFNDCSHENEPGCAIRQAIEDGTIDLAQLESYRKLKKESARNEMSYADKRKHDKAFGRHIQSVLKDIKMHRKKH